MTKRKKKPLSPLHIAHQKFLKKYGVTKQELKARKEDRQNNDITSKFNPDTLDSVRKAYD